MSHPSVTDPINYDDLEPIVVPVSIKKVQYFLVEASADAAMKYRNASLGAAKLSDGKITGMDGMASCEPLLVSRCLFVAGSAGELRLDVTGNPDTQFLVPLATILGWPNRVQAGLYKRVRDISPSLIVDGGDEGPKEVPSATIPTSV